MNLWIAVIATGLGCYLLKLAGMAAPRGLVDRPLVRRFVLATPIALLAALIALQTLAQGQELVLDVARLGGLAAAVLTLLLRAPFLVVLIAAALTTAVLRAVGVG
ncbi:AzlD domain-containing protein [Salinactinospora qingdaonensis]|uniref:AzlD domain-containing protein n=1 Tax=Salinactinospora qingdaonensis TaxID=702744 RepID=A0ABP7FPZ2_9ACTN